LCSHLIISGFNAVGIDHSKNRHCPKGPIVVLDVTITDHQLIIFDIVTSGRCFFVNAAPPCGTSSRARNKPVAPELVARGAPNPLPLRSDEFPEGLPHLSGVALHRVSQANLIYYFVFQLFELCMLHNVLISVENPSNSYMWQIWYWQQMLSSDRIFVSDFQACMHGGKRDKWTRFVSNFPQIRTLDAVCDKSHQHEPWGASLTSEGWKFNTAQEAEYPSLLCSRISSIVLDVALHNGALLTDSDSHCGHEAIHFHKTRNRASLGKLLRGRKIPVFVQDFSSFETIKCRVVDGTPVVPPLADCKKIVSRRFSVGGNGGSADPDSQDIESSCSLVIGKLRTPSEFISAAVEAGHPNSLDQVLPPQLEGAVLNHSTLGSSGIASKRVEWAKRWLRRRLELSREQSALTSAAPAHIRSIAGDKQTLLLKEMLSDVNYPDTDVADLLVAGAELGGWLPETEVFQKKVKVPTLSVGQLKSVAKINLAAALTKVSSSSDPDMDRQVWSATLEEVDKGWIEGPVSTDQLPDDAVVSRRFGIRQSDKVRVIDDFSESLVNSTVGSYEKIDLMAVDETASLMIRFMKEVPGIDLRARTFDLKSAYRQVPLTEESRELAYICVYCPDDGCPKIFKLNCLPFGATAAVYHFNRCAIALWYLGTAALDILWTNYYDDFTVVCPLELVPSTESAVLMLFKLTGWLVAMDGKKASDFSQLCHSLGVVFDLTLSSTGTLNISNTERRIKELVETIDGIISSSVLTFKQAESLCSRMLFADSQVFGRKASQCFRMIREAHKRIESLNLLDCQSSIALLWLRDHVLQGPPRSLNINKKQCFYVFTDGACEGDHFESVSAGGVLVNGSGKILEFFGVELPTELVSVWQSTGSSQTIGQAELWPVLLSLVLWKNFLTESDTVFYIDNDSARFGLIKAYSPSVQSNLIISAFVNLELSLKVNSWFARVPSFSNPADEPSRLKFDNLLSAGGVQICVPELFLRSEFIHEIGTVGQVGWSGGAVPP